ncbi:MAG TPA: hypothetical protein VFB92_22690 [Vicinamibacterales bacterium]|nr:hypothetical protein [Vicinamibacterales bacterium]
MALIAASSGMPVVAQYRNGQARPQSAATRPGPPRAPAGDGTIRERATLRPRPISPSLGIPLRRPYFPVFPLMWGWGTLPFYYDSVNAPIALEEGATGGIQLDVQPWRASVFVDGVYAGRVSDFNGYYKHLDVVAGSHQIVIVEPGYQPLVIAADVIPGRTITYRETLHP